MRGALGIGLTVGLMVAVMAAGTAAGGFLFFDGNENPRVALGVRVSGIPLGGLARADATAALEAARSQGMPGPLRLQHEQRTWVLYPERFGVGHDVSATLDRAFAVGRRGSLPRRLKEVVVAAWKGHKVPPAFKYDEIAVREFLLAIADEVNVQPKNASIEPLTGAVVDSRIGYWMNVAESLARVRSAWASGRSGALSLAVGRLAPRTATGEIQPSSYRFELSSYSTYFDQGNRNRARNIALAAGLLDGVILEAGEIFSFNRIVGPRTRERGFKEALEIIGQEFVPGIGGGVCQASSTLYNVALLAGLEIVERRNHTRPLSYVGLGRDATVYSDVVDLKFRNTFPFPVLVTASADSGRLRVGLNGARPLSERVAILTSEREGVRAPTKPSTESQPLAVSEPADRGEPGGGISPEAEAGARNGREDPDGYTVAVYRVRSGLGPGGGSQDEVWELVSTDSYPPPEPVPGR
ncbi:MAG: VanW family protein [Firmicutes bacterium]|nr:VanW family protein [Bacillota bacterium]